MTAPLSDKAIALLPCAMCGEMPGRIVELVPGKVWSVGCNQLRHSTQAMSWVSAEDCANSWNRRTPARKGAASHGEDERGPESACYQAYQAVGSMLSDLGLFDTEKGQKLLDNLSQARVVHDDVLPWESASHGEDIHSCSPYCERPECVRERGEDEARVEGAAIAICAVSNSITVEGARYEWPNMTDHAKDGYRRMARAALTAITAKGEG